jgi:hypothetical protein
MEPTFEKQECVTDEDVHSHGTELCDDEKCLICVNGKWVNKDDLESAGC